MNGIKRHGVQGSWETWDVMGFIFWSWKGIGKCGIFVSVQKMIDK